MGSQPRKFLGVQILSRDARQGGDSAGNVEELLEAKMYRMCRNGREKEQIELFSLVNNPATCDHREFLTSNVKT